MEREITGADLLLTREPHDIVEQLRIEARQVAELFTTDPKSMGEGFSKIMTNLAKIENFIVEKVTIERGRTPYIAGIYFSGGIFYLLDTEGIRSAWNSQVLK